MRTRTWIRLTGFVLMMTAIHVVSLAAQVVKREKGREKIWFIARVVSTEPFMLEYMDDWYRHQEPIMPSQFYDSETDTNPQSKLEGVSKFKLGDIIGGEFFVPVVFDLPP